MLTNIIDFANFFNSGVQDDILDSLPFAITVQNQDRIVLYENKAAVDFLGSWLGRKCFLRWSYKEDYENKICSDCPGHVTFVDQTSHKIVKQTKDPNGNSIILEITHVPIRKDSEHFESYIEIMRNITFSERQNIDLLNFPKNELMVSFTRFGYHGGEIMKTTPLNFLENDKPSELLIKMSAFWFAAIGQGHNWPKGLFGPLPVLDYTNYNSYAYSLKLKCEDPHDTRLGDDDLILCLLFTNRFDNHLNENTSQIEGYLEKYFEGIDNTSQITEELLNNLQQEILSTFMN